MSLPVPKLDEKTWSDIVESARLRIPQTTNDWTDWNAHDPGITFIELFAWLAEMQRFRLDQVSRATQERFFDLVNLEGREVRPAEGWVQLEAPASDPSSAVRAGWVLVPAGTPIKTLLFTGTDPFAFQLTRDSFVTTHRVRRLVSDTGDRRIDQLEANTDDDVTFFAFGAEAPEGAMLEIELEALVAVPTIEVWIHLFEDDLPSVGEHGDESADFEPSVTLQWDFYDGADWRALQIQSDDTLSFHQTGAIRFARPLAARVGRPLAMRCRVVAGVFEIPPRLRAVRLNVVEVTQVETEINEEDEEMEGGNGRPDQDWQLKHDHVLEPYEAEREIQVGDVIDWEDLDRKLRVSDPEPEIAALMRCFPAGMKTGRDAPGTCLPTRREDRDLACCKIVAGLNDAHDGQRIRDDLPAHFSAGGPTIEILEARNAKPTEWVVWERVEDFRDSTHEDRHYTLDFDTGRVRFGNGLNGRVPATGERIRARTYRHTRGSRGNLAAKQRWVSEVGGLTLRGDNPDEFTGGRDREEIKDSRARAERAFHRRQRGVTGSDLEQLALSTPGVRVARAEALPNHDPRFAPSTQVPGSSTVVVVPQRRPDDRRSPDPGDGFLRTIRRHLDQHRLVTTTIHVIGPEFVEFAIIAQVNLKRRSAPDEAEARVRRELERFFDPFRGGPESEGWPFGRSVHPSEIYERLDRDPGVEYSVKVQLTAPGAPAPLGVDAKLDLPPQGLPSFSWQDSDIQFIRFGEGRRE